MMLSPLLRSLFLLLTLISTGLWTGCEDRQALNPGIFAYTPPPAPYVFDQSVYNQQFVDPFMEVLKPTNLVEAYTAYAGTLAALKSCFTEDHELNYFCATQLHTVGLQQFLAYAGEVNNFATLQSANPDQANALTLNVAHAAALRDTMARYRAGALQDEQGPVHFASQPDAHGRSLQIVYNGFPAKNAPGPTLSELFESLAASNDGNLAYALPSGDLEFAVSTYLMDRPYSFLPQSQNFVPLAADLSLAKGRTMATVAAKMEREVRRYGKASLPQWLVANEIGTIKASLEAESAQKEGQTIDAAKIGAQAQQLAIAKFSGLLVRNPATRKLQWRESDGTTLELQAVQPPPPPPVPLTWRQQMRLRSLCLVSGSDPRQGCAPVVGAGIAKILEAMQIRDRADIANRYLLNKLLLEVYPAPALNDSSATLHRATFLQSLFERLNDRLDPQVAVIQTVVLEPLGTWLAPLCDDEAYLEALTQLEAPTSTCSGSPWLAVFDRVDDKLHYRFSACETQLRSAGNSERFIDRVLGND